MLQRKDDDKVKQPKPDVSKVVEEYSPNKRELRLTLQNLIASGEEIWVKNRSAKVTGMESGNIVLQVGSGNMVDMLIIPPGSDPVCLTDQVTPKLLAECMDLFKLVKSEALELLDPAKAHEYYAKNQERKKVVDEKISKLTKKTREDGAAPRTVVAATGNVEVNPKVGDICLKAKHAAISEHEALEKLFEQEEVLKIDDYNYLINNGIFAGIKRWAKDQMKKLIDE